MTPFQAIKATFDMLLARARQPSDARESIPAPLITHQYTRAEPSTDSEWTAHRHSDANR